MFGFKCIPLLQISKSLINNVHCDSPKQKHLPNIPDLSYSVFYFGASDEMLGFTSRDKMCHYFERNLFKQQNLSDPPHKELQKVFGDCQLGHIQTPTA